MNIDKLIKRIEHTAPLRGAASWDKSGVQIAGRLKETNKVALMLDPLPSSIAEALDWGAGFILSHHPLTMEPRFLDRLGGYHDIARMVLSKDAWLYAAHTSLDAQLSGPAAWFVQELGIRKYRPLEPTFTALVHRLLFPMPGSADLFAEKWATLPGVLQTPNIESGQMAICCEENAVQSIMRTIRMDIEAEEHELYFTIQQTHLPAVELGIGQAGALPQALSWSKFLEQIHKFIPREFVTIAGIEPEAVRTVACCPGSGASLADKAASLGAEVLVTGDLKHHSALRPPLCLVDVGHFSLEEEMMRRFALLLKADQELSDTDIQFFPGQDPLRLALTR